MAFDGKEGAQISLAEGAAMTLAYRNSDCASGARAHFMGKNILGSILSQTGCVGIRAYYGIDTNGDKQLVFVGVNAAGNDLTSGIVADRAIGCPTNCDSNSSPL